MGGAFFLLTLSNEDAQTTEFVSVFVSQTGWRCLEPIWYTCTRNLCRYTLVSCEPQMFLHFLELFAFSIGRCRGFWPLPIFPPITPNLVYLKHNAQLRFTQREGVEKRRGLLLSAHVPGTCPLRLFPIVTSTLVETKNAHRVLFVVLVVSHWKVAVR